MYSRYAEVSVLPEEPLLDVGVLVDDSRLERREVGRRRARELRGERLLERSRAGRPERVVRRVHARNRGEVEPELGQIRRDLDRASRRSRPVCPAREPPAQRDLDVLPTRPRQVCRPRRSPSFARSTARRARGRSPAALPTRVVDVEVVTGVDVVRGGRARQPDCVCFGVPCVAGFAAPAGSVGPRRTSYAASDCRTRRYLVRDAEGIRARRLAGTGRS